MKVKTFKQHLNALERKRRNMNKPSGNGIVPNYVHGKHSNAIETTEKNGIVPNYVHGKHSRNNINEQNLADLTKRDLEKLPDTLMKFKNVHPNKKEIDTRLGDYYHPKLIQHPDKNHVFRYTKHSGALNRGLLSNYKVYRHNNNPLQNDEHEERKKGIDRLLQDIPAPEDITTYAGLGYSPQAIATSDPREFAHLPGHEHLANMEPEEGYMYVHSPAYQSSSVSFFEATSFAKPIDPKNPNTIGSSEHGVNHLHISRIKVPKGSRRGAYVNTISNFGRGNQDPGVGELEFIHPRGVTYRVPVNPTESVANAYGEKNRAHHIWDYEPIASIHS